MTQDLLQDLVFYKKSLEKAESSAARSLITLFREVCWQLYFFFGTTMHVATEPVYSFDIFFSLSVITLLLPLYKVGCLARLGEKAVLHTQPNVGSTTFN